MHPYHKGRCLIKGWSTFLKFGSFLIDQNYQLILLFSEAFMFKRTMLILENRIHQTHVKIGFHMIPTAFSQ